MGAESGDYTPNTTYSRLRRTVPVVVVSYAFFLAMAAVSIPNMAGSGTPPAPAILANWFYLAAHGVPINVYVSEVSAQALTMPIGNVPGWLPLYWLVPPVGLTLAGYSTARTTHLPTQWRGFRAGSSVAWIYGPAMLVLAVVSRHYARPPRVMIPERVSLTGELSFTLVPDIAATIVLAGIVYPVVFGGFGGAVAHAGRVGRGTLLPVNVAIGTTTELVYTPFEPLFEWRRRHSNHSAAVTAGLVLTAVQLPGFFLTHELYIARIAVPAGEVYFGSFPMDGYLLFVVAAFAIGALSWRFVTTRPTVPTVQQAVTLGWGVGLAVHAVVWGVGLVVYLGVQGETPTLIDMLSWWVMTYSTGWIQSLCCAAMLGLMVSDRNMRQFYRGYVQ